MYSPEKRFDDPTAVSWPHGEPVRSEAVNDEPFLQQAETSTSEGEVDLAEAPPAEASSPPAGPVQDAPEQDD